MKREIFESTRSLACNIISMNICISFLLKLFRFSLLKLVDVSPVMNMHVLESTLAKICKLKGQRYHRPPDHGTIFWPESSPFLESENVKDCLSRICVCVCASMQVSMCLYSTIFLRE